MSEFASLRHVSRNPPLRVDNGWRLDIEGGRKQESTSTPKVAERLEDPSRKRKKRDLNESSLEWRLASVRIFAITDMLGLRFNWQEHRVVSPRNPVQVAPWPENSTDGERLSWEHPGWSKVAVVGAQFCITSGWMSIWLVHVAPSCLPYLWLVLKLIARTCPILHLLATYESELVGLRIGHTPTLKTNWLTHERAWDSLYAQQIKRSSFRVPDLWCKAHSICAAYRDGGKDAGVSGAWNLLAHVFPCLSVFARNVGVVWRNLNARRESWIECRAKMMLWKYWKLNDDVKWNWVGWFAWSRHGSDSQSCKHCRI